MTLVNLLKKQGGELTMREIGRRELMWKIE